MINGKFLNLKTLRESLYSTSVTLLGKKQATVHSNFFEQGGKIPGNRTVMHSQPSK